MLSEKSELLTKNGWIQADSLVAGDDIACVYDNKLHFEKVRTTWIENRKHYEFWSKWFHFAVCGDIPTLNRDDVVTEVFSPEAYYQLRDATGIHSNLMTRFRSGLDDLDDQNVGLYLYSMHHEGDDKVEIKIRGAKDKQFFWDHAGKGPNSVASYNEKHALCIIFNKPSPIRWPLLSQRQLEHTYKVATRVHGCAIGKQEHIVHGLSDWDADYLQFAGYMNGAFSTQRRGLAVHFQHNAHEPGLTVRSGARAKEVHGPVVGIRLKSDRSLILSRYNYHISVQFSDT